MLHPSRIARVLLLALIAVTLSPRASSALSGGYAGYAGPRYTASTDFPTTIALMNMGGGPERFSPKWALRKLVGQKIADEEVAMLNSAYGPPDVNSFFEVFKFAMDDAARLEREKRVVYPRPALSGRRLATQVFQDATVGGAPRTGYLFDHLFTQQVTDRVMRDIDIRFGARQNATFQRVGNQVLFDLARAIGTRNVALADGT